MCPPLENNPKTPPSSRDEGLRLLHCRQILYQLSYQGSPKSISLLSHIQLFVTLWTVACQAPLSMEFPRQEYWNGLSFLSPGDHLAPGIEPESPGK